MRTALVLLFLLALAAVPGSLVPQRSVDAARAAQFAAEHPTLAPWYDRLSLFSVYSSPWYAATYLLLFVSLVGCVLPRSRAHLAASLARPPRAPRNFDRLPVHAIATTDRSPAPFVHATDDSTEMEFRVRYRAFVDAFRAGAQRLRERASEIREMFPLWAFPPQLPFHETA